MLLVFIMMIGLAVSAAIASRKNRNAIAWGICGAMFPLITVLILAASPAVPTLDEGAL